MQPSSSLSADIQYLIVVAGLFIVPRMLQRFRLPSAITCVILGAILGMGFGFFSHDPVLPLLATLGIVALFLFAGLEVDFADLRKGASITLLNLVLQIALVALGVAILRPMFGIEWRAAMLLALAILTPSTGFILDALARFDLDADQQFWVKTKAISTELLALLALFVVVQSHTATNLAVASAALVALVFILPAVFHAFASWILPHAPKSEFAFLVILALVCASATRELGVYYLVGAFVVGVTAVRLRKRIPQLASQRVTIGIELFASFFIPFYFFKAGLHLEKESFTWRAVLLGLLFVAIAVPLRVGSVAVLRRVALREKWSAAAKVGLSLVPTLVFTIVLADILKERYAISTELYGALMVYALVTTVIPGFVLRGASSIAFLEPHLRPGGLETHMNAEETPAVG